MPPEERLRVNFDSLSERDIHNAHRPRITVTDGETVVGAAAEVNRYETALSDIFGIGRAGARSFDGNRLESSKRCAKPKLRARTGATNCPHAAGPFEVISNAR